MAFLLKVSFMHRSCVEKASAVGTPNAIRYVRRAAELCDALSAPVPGLCQECVDYIKAHPSNVYDMAALHLFAKGLKAAGQRDKAAAVYFTLLEVRPDMLAPERAFTQLPLVTTVSGPQLYYESSSTISYCAKEGYPK